MNAIAPSPPAFSEEEKARIEEQVERLVADAHFAHSRRFPSFLRYIVAETLAGNVDQLKERTIGMEIFGKAATYDTATEPIVRVTAAEIRKRIAQYYQEPGHAQEMRVSLPPGSYVPQFEFPATSAESEPLPIASEPSAAPVEAAAHGSRNVVLWAAGVVLMLLVLIAAGFAWWQHTQDSAFRRFWNPILGSSDPVLFSVADQTHYGSLYLRDAADPSRQVELKDNLTAIVIDDLTAITKIAGVLEASHHKYELRGENTTQLSDLRAGPSVIVGAFDNSWTLRLLAPLRFHFANNAAMTTFSIVDSKPGGHASWTVDREQQLATNNYVDYAIVALFTDAITGKPTLVAAGIGRGGTVAAGEFLTSPQLLDQVLSQQPSSQASNVEVVLSTHIIDGEPGTPNIEAVYYW